VCGLHFLYINISIIRYLKSIYMNKYPEGSFFFPLSLLTLFLVCISLRHTFFNYILGMFCSCYMLYCCTFLFCLLTMLLASLYGVYYIDLASVIISRYMSGFLSDICTYSSRTCKLGCGFSHSFSDRLSLQGSW
jgi:hypothetical protein